MFLRQHDGWRLENTRTQTMKCLNCGNTSEHFVHVAPHGFQIGLVFLQKPLLGGKKYFLACPTCGSLSKEISKEQADALKV